MSSREDDTTGGGGLIDRNNNGTKTTTTTTNSNNNSREKRHRKNSQHRASARFSLATRISGAEHSSLLHNIHQYGSGSSGNQQQQQHDDDDDDDYGIIDEQHHQQSSYLYQHDPTLSSTHMSPRRVGVMRNNKHKNKHYDHEQNDVPSHNNNNNNNNSKNSSALKKMYSIQQDCSPTSIGISTCLCMNFVTIVATVALCLIFLNGQGLHSWGLKLDRAQYSRQLFFPKSNIFAKNVRYSDIMPVVPSPSPPPSISLSSRFSSLLSLSSSVPLSKSSSSSSSLPQSSVGGDGSNAHDQYHQSSDVELNDDNNHNSYRYHHFDHDQTTSFLDDEHALDVTSASDKDGDPSKLQAIIYSLSSDPLIDPSGYRTKHYGFVSMDALKSGGMNYEYWTFTLNKGSVVHLESLIRYTPIAPSIDGEDAIYLDIVVGDNYFDMWRNGKRSLASHSIQLHSNNVTQSFEFKVVQRAKKQQQQQGEREQERHSVQNGEQADDHRSDDDSSVMTDIHISQSTDVIYFIFYYHLSMHGEVSFAMANFTVDYSNLIPDDSAIIGQCLLLREDCVFARDDYPPVTLILSNSDALGNQTYSVQRSVELYNNKVIPICLSPLMLCFVLDVLSMLWLCVSLICCETSHQKMKKERRSLHAMNKLAEEESTAEKSLSLLQNEHRSDRVSTYSEGMTPVNV